MAETTFYLEFLQLGPQVKVVAIDPETGIEVSIIAPKTATKTEMTRVAVDKLKHVLSKAQAQTEAKPDEADDKRGGILV